MKKKNLFIFIMMGVGILFIILFFVLNGKDNNNNNNDNNNNNGTINGSVDNDIKNNVKEDIKKDNEKGIVLTNLNSAFINKEGKETKEFVYEFTFNGEREKLVFKDIVLNNGDKEAKMTMYLNDVQIDVMKIINNSIVRTPSAIIPKFYLIGNKNDEVLVLEILTNDTNSTSKVYIALNNEGEVRNSFGGLANDSVSEAEFLKAIKEGNLIYDHKISEAKPEELCTCNASKNPNANKVISETKVFTILDSSLIIDHGSEYTCANYCKNK